MVRVQSTTRRVFADRLRLCDGSYSTFDMYSRRFVGYPGRGRVDGVGVLRQPVSGQSALRRKQR